MNTNDSLDEFTENAPTSTQDEDRQFTELLKMNRYATLTDNYEDEDMSDNQDDTEATKETIQIRTQVSTYKDFRLLRTTSSCRYGRS